MKKIEKVFWVSSEGLEWMKKNGYVLTSQTLSSCKEEDRVNKITISYEEPEKKIELTESGIESACQEVEGHSMNGKWYVHADSLKQKLFYSSGE